MPQGSPGQERLTLIVYALLLLAIGVGVAVVLTQQPATAVISIIPPLPTPTPPPIRVYVSGAVAQPGSYALPPESRVEAALMAAGGTTDVADLARINLAAAVRDGDQIHVYAHGEGAVALATPSGGERLSINTATLEELDALPGIGPALAERIIAYRTINGVITNLDDLGNVEGIGAALLDELEPLIRFD